MSLNLDDRQRAMLDAMGVTVWWPQGTPAPDLNQVTAAAAEIEADSWPSERLSDKPALTTTTVAVQRTGATLASQSWTELKTSVAQCKTCGLCETRKNTVFGTGQAPVSPRITPQVEWMIIGDAPGEYEDLQAEPFVGQDGKLLDNMLRSVGIARDRGAFITNVLKCRPPGNRNPTSGEIAQCTPFLLRQIQLLQPKLVLVMGRIAINTLLAPSVPGVADIPIGKLRGQVHQFDGIPVVVTYHPTYLLRNLPEKAKAWADLCLAHEVITGGA